MATVATKKTNTGLVAYLKSKLGTPYVYGMDGQKLTKDHINALKKAYPSTYTTAYVNQVSKSLGKQVFDCSGSINSYIMGGEGAYDPAKDWCSSTIKSKSKLVKPIAEYKSMPVGSTVWRSGHVGTYIGEDKVIETRTAYGPGLEVRPISAGKWTHIMLHPGIEYDGYKDKKSAKTIASKKVDNIKELQQILNKKGFKDKNGNAIKEDGKIGPLTISACPVLKVNCAANKYGALVKWVKTTINEQLGTKASVTAKFNENTAGLVRKYQRKNKLTENGKVNEKTWMKLTGYN